MVTPLARIPAIAPAQAERLARRWSSTDGDLWELLDDVVDPEIPALSLWDLGVLRDVRREGNVIRVVITPTYSGCPAMEAMTAAIRGRLSVAGFRDVVIDRQLAPAWTTDWLDSGARARLRRDGIAPPELEVCCPQCGATDTRVVSEFGSTACKALVRCAQCGETFHHFKRI